MTNYNDRNPNVWADGFGQWHASVPLQGSPTREALAARALIKAAIIARAPRGTIRPYFHVTRKGVTAHGTVIYGER